MKNTWVWVLVVVAVVGLVYLGRHKIKTMLGMSQVTPTTEIMAKPTFSMAPSNNIYTSKTDPQKGNYLADFAGTSLYVFDKDTVGVSNCNGNCAQLWPPYSSGATAQSQFPPYISVLTRTDGSKQFAWKGMPLYYYAKDKAPGDVMGDGVGGFWHLVKP